MMKLKFLATGIAPDKYKFEGEKVIINEVEYDLSVFREGDILEVLEGEDYILDIQRIDGELYVTLCQKAPKGHWRGIDEYINSADYNPNKLYIREITEEELLQEQRESQEFGEIEEKSTNSYEGMLKIRKASDV